MSQRLQAMEVLATNGIHVGVTMMPILPFIEDNEDNIADIIRRAKDVGATYILPSMSMTLRDRQRDYYYEKLDKLFPGLSDKYRKKFGGRYGCPANNADRLYKLFSDLCEQYGIATRVPQYAPPPSPEQLTLF